MERPLCIWHDHCLDGFTSAWIVNKFFKGEIDFYPGTYGNPPPPKEMIQDRNILIVDFSYKKPQLTEMASSAKGIVVLDHHESAKDELAGFMWPQGFRGNEVLFPNKGIACVFDMRRSGAGITWDYLNAGMKRPVLVDAVEDRDLWVFDKPFTREINAALRAYDMTFEAWQNLVDRVQDDEERQEIVAEGSAIIRIEKKQIKTMLDATTRPMRIGGYEVPCANLPIHQSEALNQLCQDMTFAASYFDGPNWRYFSLRSEKGALNVAKIASHYGGGGHPHAAGFRMPLGWEGDNASVAPVSDAIAA